MNIESLASNLLELASEQRLEILQLVMENPQTLSEIKKQTDRTASETHRNLQRLLDSQLLDKAPDGKYAVSNFGKVVRFQLDSLDFFANHKEFLKNHPIEIPEEFARRLGDLAKSEMVFGFVAVQEIWQKIYKNSEKYICSMLQEAFYDSDTMSILHEKLRSGINLRSLFSKESVISEKRESVKSKFSKFIKNGNLERRLCESFPSAIFCNEKEGCVCFSDSTGRIDLGTAFYGNSKSFQKWCLDFFEYSWDASSTFSENKMTLK